MADYKQVSRHLRLDTPLGEDRLLVTRFSGREEISRLFTYRLDLLSEDDAIAPADIVGKNVTITLGLLDGTERHFNGYVSAFACCGTGDRLSRYTAEVVPWLWFLTRTADCRIFQDKSMPSVIEQVFQDLEFTDYEIADVRGDHAPRHFCVQYRETDFNFVSRLMEDAGIFYYFRHEKDRHVLVLADQNATHADCPEKDVSVAAPERGGDPTDSLENWTHRYEFRPGKWTHTDFNFETPSALLQASTGTLVDIPGASRYEIYDYPGGYTTRNEGEAAVKIRMEEEEAAFDTVTASGSCRTFFAGGKFTVAWHHSGAEEGKAYVITSLRHEASLGGAYLTGGEAAALEYRNEFACIPAAVTFRPARSTPRPAVRGAQTAIVVGPAGEEIYTDKYGRVKVQFHWDREGKRDENSSCWIRVAQLWAGRKWGAMYVPRIGQEVVVEFIEGDPDRPLITGSVYNNDQMPHYDLPDEQTKTYIKTNSSKGGEGHNEIMFDDRKDSEQVYVHAQKNMDVRVRNDSKERIYGNRHQVIGWQDDETGDKGIEAVYFTSFVMQ